MDSDPDASTDAEQWLNERGVVIDLDSPIELSDLLVPPPAPPVQSAPPTPPAVEENS